MHARDSYVFCGEVWVIVLMWPYRKLKRKGWGKSLRVSKTFCLLKTSVRLQTLMSLPLELNLWQPCQWLSSIIYILDWTTILAGGIQRCNWHLIQLIPYVMSLDTLKMDHSFLWSNPVYFFLYTSGFQDTLSLYIYLWGCIGWLIIWRLYCLIQMHPVKENIK